MVDLRLVQSFIGNERKWGEIEGNKQGKKQSAIKTEVEKMVECETLNAKGKGKFTLEQAKRVQGGGEK
jgi:hypothetical protein